MASKSFASRLLRLIQAKKRSTALLQILAADARAADRIRCLSRCLEFELFTEVDGAPVLVDGPIKVSPPAGDLDIRLVTAPACAFRRFQPSIPIETSDLFRSKPAGDSDDTSRVTMPVASG